MPPTTGAVPRFLTTSHAAWDVRTPKISGVRGGQAERIVSRRAVAGSEVGDNQARSQRVGPRGQMWVVGGEAAVGEHDIKPQIGCVVGK